MNWFERHLNWSVVLAWFILTIISFLTIMVLEDVFLAAIYPGIILPNIMLLVVVGWMIKRKNRSLWWLLLWYVPFGCLFVLTLTNKRDY